MKLLRLFRAPELAFWSAAVAALCVVLVVSARLGHHEQVTGTTSNVAAVPGATSSAAGTAISNLVALMQAGTAAGTDPTALSAWATSLQQQASAGTAARTAEGAAGGDDLLAEFATVSSLCDQLRVDASKPVPATALRTQIGLHVSRLQALRSGSPAPALPAGSVDTFAGSPITTQAPAVSSPPAPTVPTVPTTRKP